MESGIEYGVLIYVGQELAAGKNPGEVVRVVQGRQVYQLFDGVDHGIVDEDGFLESLASVHDTMADRPDLGEVGDRTRLDQAFQRDVDRLAMGLYFCS